MKLPLHIAKRLQQLLLPGETVPGSSMQHPSVVKMLEDGILQKQQQGKTKAVLFISKNEQVAAYLQNHFSINDLDEYIKTAENNDGKRADHIVAAGNSKLRPIRTFKGFLVNCYDDITGVLNGQQVIIRPLTGTYTFIHAYENFIPEEGVTIVGIENAENFNAIEQQRYLFRDKKPLFVSRYPQSNDLVKWLTSITNPYLHFGDLDFAGISIYEHEFKKHLHERASFLVPEHTELLLQQFGNRSLFNKQFDPLANYVSPENDIQQLIDWIIKYRKVLEQEIFITAHGDVQ